MKEIKFRAWGENIKEYMSQSFDGEIEIANVTRILGDLIDQGNWVIEQYTGLKDKNGKEIYEGDIIESWYLNGDGNGGYYDAGNFEVVFKNGAFGLTRKDSFYTFDEIEWDEIRDIKVIGNIHENPELLGGEE